MLDFDKTGRAIGAGALNASHLLRPDHFDRAQWLAEPDPHENHDDHA